MLIIQIILILFFLFAVLKAVGRWRKGELSGRGLAVWIVFWLAAAFVAAWPDFTFYLARAVGIGRGADLVVYLALAGAFFAIFRLTARLEKMERNITKMARKMALEERPSAPTAEREN